MADCIDRKKLLDSLSAAAPHGGIGAIIAETLMKYVERQPAVGVVSVVRCRDCKHWRDKIPYTGKKLGFHWCDKFCNSIVVGDDYCSYGELRGGGDSDGR